MLNAEEALTDRYLYDSRLDSVFAVCSACRRSSWVPDECLFGFQKIIVYKSDRFAMPGVRLRHVPQMPGANPLPVFRNYFYLPNVPPYRKWQTCVSNRPAHTAIEAFRCTRATRCAVPRGSHSASEDCARKLLDEMGSGPPLSLALRSSRCRWNHGPKRSARAGFQCSTIWRKTAASGPNTSRKTAESSPTTMAFASPSFVLSIFPLKICSTSASQPSKGNSPANPLQRPVSCRS